MTLQELLHLFDIKLSTQRINAREENDPQIFSLYNKIVYELGQSHENYISGVSSFLLSLEENNQYSVQYEVDVFMELIMKIMGKAGFSDLDNTIVDGSPSFPLMEKFFKLFMSQVPKGSKIRLSEHPLDFSALTLEEKKQMVGGLVSKIQEDSKQLNWNDDMVTDTLNFFVGMQELLVRIGQTEHLYHALGLFLDRLSSSEMNQMGRNISEEIIVTSFKDGQPALGFFSAFRFYSNTSSIHAALMYANISFLIVLNSDTAISKKFAEEMLWQGMKLFRNVGLDYFVLEIYKLKPNGLFSDSYMRRAFDHTYFTGLLAVKDPGLPSLLLDYLRMEREQIFIGGVYDAQPWLITLYNIKHFYPDADFSVTGLGFFASIFEQIVPEELFKKQKDILLGNSEAMKIHLRESLQKLNETFYEKDFVYDNENALKNSSRLIPLAFENQDPESFLLSMLIKSDFSILFKENRKPVGDNGKRELDEFKYPDIYKDPVQISKLLPLAEKDVLTWLAISGNNMYQMILLGGKYEILNVAGWSNKALRKIENSEFFTHLKFQESKKDRGEQVYMVSPEEHLAESVEIKKELAFAAIKVPENTESLFLIKDMELSGLPHNMFLDGNGDFVSEHRAVTNIISTEWLLSASKEPLNAGYSKALWNPVDSGDMALAYLDAYLDDTCTAYGIEKKLEVEIVKPLSADLNIVCSHGGSDIADLQFVRHQDTATLNLDKVIGPGKILILFVCHSGTQQNELFRNNLQSLIKRYLSSGYQAVIAPAWALDIGVPKIWLPEFLKAIDNKERLDRAVFLANKAVFNRFPTAAAWANLHLYGNPFLSVV